MRVDLFPRGSRALVKQHLTPEIYLQLKSKKTDSGFTLDQAIQSGIKNPDSSIGLYAGDSQSYALFSDLFDPVIRSYHRQTRPHIHDLSPLNLEDLDPGGRFILSTRIRTARNLKGFCFPPHMKSAERDQVEQNVMGAVKRLPSEFGGEYISLDGLAPGKMENLLSRKWVFPRGDRFMDAAGINKEFPRGRGAFISRSRKTDREADFLIWVNEEDHLRIIAMENTSNISRVFNRLVLGLESLCASLEFAVDPEHGFLTSCPTNIGTAMRAGVHIRLEKLEKRMEVLERLARLHNLQIRGTGGEKTAVQEAVFDISNRIRLGRSERQIIQDLHQGLGAILEAEKNL
ncbi:phosphagen kinase [Desulfospira joergensenii]|uniref:phosphagen kinase n=1 Tax=Desulfospira joergensenii TaxID=53329 RepID=UPI0003B52582|nr:phosphagen kinase [Desulfospira joergensenii]